MTYLEGFMTLQKRYVGRQRGVYLTQQADVYDLPERVYDTSEGAYWTIEEQKGVYDQSGGQFRVQMGYIGQQEGVLMQLHT